MAGFGNIASNMVDAATEMAKQVGVEAVTSTFVSIRNLGENYERLKQDLLLLLALRDDKEREVQRNRHKDTSSAYRLWTTEVSETAEKVNCLINRYERERDSSNWIWKRSNLYTEMEKRLTQVQQLVGNGHSVDFLVDKPPDRVLKVFDAPQIAGYQTLQSTLENVIDLLRSNKISTIGVHGMKGVGKTAVMQNLNNHDLVAKLFDIVIYVRLSADHTDHELQCKIAKRLKLDTELINDPGEVAARIHEELQSKKYLLILDEVEDEINLTRLGIPCNDNQSKVVVTAQNSQVCTVNGADRLIKVGALSRDEAWKMFRNIVGSVIDFPDIETVARRVCDKCSCLPLLIHKIARSFRLKRSASSWRVGLDDLEERWPDYENEGENELYSFLMFCYDELKDDNTKKCFLYASLYPANCKVYTDYLVECWAAQDFLGDVDDTRKYQKARDRGHAILEHLTDVSLLDEGKQMIYVTMNDCMKRLASHISSKNPECSSYIQTREKLEEGQESMSWKDARWVSMIDNNLQDLPTDQDCSTLSALLLQKNPDLFEIPSLFFKKHMRCLLVLDLYGTGIRQLPSTISKLTGLKGLYLNGCKHLTQLPEAIKSLVFLEFLDIRGTKMNFISPQIGYLTNLRCLRIPYIKNGDQSEDQEADTEPCPISRLTKLEELVIEVVSYQDWCRDAENVMAMLASLEHLTDLQCSFPSSNILERLLTRRSGRQFTSFRFFVGCQNSKRPQILESFEYRISKYIRYDNSKHENTLSISEVLPQTHAFELINFKDITELSHLGKENMEHIRGLSLEQCDEIHTLIAGNENGVGDVSTLPNLEQLHLTSLLKLNCVIRGPLHHGSLSKLKVLTLKNCPSLKSIFGNGAIQYLSELQILKIQGCPEFEELGLVNEIGETCVLPKLEMLMLVNLPRFMFVSTNDTLSWSSLEQVNVHRCPALKSLPFCKDNATNLRSIRGEQGWWNELQWTNKDHFQDMFLPSAKDFSDEQVLNYDQVFVRDFVPSALAFLLNGEGEIVKNFLLHTLQLQSWEKTVDCYSPRRGLMPASFKVRTVPLDGSIEAFEEVLDPDFGESAIGRVAPVDSGLWWIMLLRAYVKLTGDYTLQERVEVQTGIRLILTHCLTDGFDMFPSLLVPDGSCMIDRRMGIHGHPLEIQALFYSALRCSREMLIVNDATKNLVAAINNRLSALSFHMREYYWVDMKKINEIYRYKTEEYSTDAVNKFNIYPEQIPSWLLEWITEDGGYFIGNLQPAHMDFRFFTLGNLWAIVSSLGTARQNRAILNLIEAKWDDLVAQMPLKICYPALEGEEWRIITGSDPKNTSWSYHNGGSWPTLLWQFTLACIKMGRPDLAQKAVDSAEKRLSVDEWPEYYDSRNGRFIGKQSRLRQTWTVAGFLTSKMLLENPEKASLLFWEEDREILQSCVCMLNKTGRRNKCSRFAAQSQILVQ